jgi:hypothetical protein
MKELKKLQEVFAPENLGNYGERGDDGVFYKTRPTQTEMVLKINELVDAVNEMQQNEEKRKEKDVKENEEKFYRLIKKGMGGIDFGFIYTKYEIERYFCFSIDTVIERGVVEPVEKPKHGEQYWIINDCGNIEDDCWSDQPEDDFRWSMGNVFESPESAEKHLKRLTNKQ